MGKCSLHHGNIFDSSAEIICHQVNCRGVMGAGIAKEVKSRFPAVYAAYRSTCEAYENHSSDLLGSAIVIETNDTSGKFIANLFAQDGYRKGPSDTSVYTDYQALAVALDEVAKMAEAYHIETVAIPFKMGCGLAGGDWNEVKTILKNIFQDSPVDLEIWKLKEK